LGGIPRLFEKDAGMTGSFSFFNVDDFCKRNNYTHDTLAAELHVSRATVFNWKKDPRGLPRVVLLALAALEANPELRSSNMQLDSRQKAYRRGTFQILKG
jgi:DNA-binding XRE family transcriptional regulator